MRGRAALLLLVGLLQMSGDLLGLPWVRKLGLATGASPAPKVFCAVDGYEAYSTLFFLEWTDRHGDRQSRPVTAASIGRLKGPYNRRNVYGAALAYGPILPDRLRSPVLAYGLTREAPILRELGIDPADVTKAWIRYEPLPGRDRGKVPRQLGPGAR